MQSITSMGAFCTWSITAVAYHDIKAGKDRTIHMMGGDKGQVNFLIRRDLQAAYQ